MSNLPPGMLGDQFKNIGVAPHLNPAFLQEMATQGGVVGGQKNIQNMVRSQPECVLRQVASSVSCKESKVKGVRAFFLC